MGRVVMIDLEKKEEFERDTKERNKGYQKLKLLVVYYIMILYVNKGKQKFLAAKTFGPPLPCRPSAATAPSVRAPWDIRAPFDVASH